MECPNIAEISFSNTSKDAIDEVRRIKKASDSLLKTVAAGHVVNIFLGNDPLKASYALYSTDFQSMAKALTAVPKITRRRIADIADMAYLSVVDYKEKQFWKAISSGCRI